MSERYLRLGNERWKNPPSARPWPWYLSAKGNMYTKGPDGRVAVVSERYEIFTFALSPPYEGDPWERSDDLFETLEECKAAALRALGVTVRQPVRLPESTSGNASSGTPSRRIVL